MSVLIKLLLKAALTLGERCCGRVLAFYNTMRCTKQ